MASPSIVVFNEAYYLAHNQDVADAVRAGVFSSGLEHWQAYGAAEGRPASAFFDLQTYKDNNGDLNEEAGFVTDADYIRHFTNYGYKEERVFLSPAVFNADIYAAQNPDLAQAEITDRLALEQHFLRSGIYEGRIAVAGFDPVAYINANADLKALLDAGGNINGYTSANIAKAGWFHYYNFGISEGRTVPAPNPTVTLTAADTSVLEGQGLTFTVHLSIPLATDTVFTYNVTGDTRGGNVDAATTADFGAVSGTITVPAGSTSYQFTITPVLDTTVENLEGFKVTLFNNAFVVVDTETAIIKDNSANAPQTFTLTTNAESVTGGASSDTVTAVLSTDGSGTTINAGDNINLGGGTDTVNVSVTGANAATVTSVTYTGVENVLVSNFATGSNTQAFDMTLADSSLSKVGVSASSVGNTTKFSGLKQVVAGQMAGGGSLTLEYAAGVASGTADVQSLTLVNVSNGTTGEPIFTANSVETLNVASTGGSNELQVKGDSLTKVVVTGNQALTLTEDAGTLAAVDASALTAALTFTSDNAADFLVKGGAGNDSITLTGSFTAGDTIDGGAGNDTLTVDSDITSALLKNVSNVEHLVLKNGNDLTLASNVSVTDFTVGTGAVVQFTTGYTAATTLTVSSTGTSVSNAANTELTISGSSANIADATITGGTGTDTLNITAGGTVAFTNITNVDKIVVVDGGDATATAGADIVLNLGAYGTALTIDASALDAAVASATDTTAETLTVNGASATVKLTITGGAGGDTITGGTNNDVINGGDGDDSIDGTAGGNDSVSGGAGNDTFNFGDKLTSGDTIDGGDGVDTLIVTSISGTALANVTNVENLALAGSGSTATLSANLSFTSIDMDSADNNAQTLILATGYTNATTVAVDAGDKVENNANVALTVSGTDASFATVTVTGGTGTDTLNIKAASDGGTAVGFAGQITKVDVVNIVDGGDAASGSSQRGKDIVLNLGEYATALKIDGTALDAGTLDSNNVLQGDETLTVSGGSATASLTILAGGGADTLISGSGNDTIVAGAGNDSIELGSGNDSVDAGAGDDTITVTAGNLNAGDVIDGGEGNDVLNLSSGDVNDTAVFSNVKNVETLKLGATTGTQSVALSTNAGSFSTIDISAAGDQVLTLNIGYTTNVNVIMTGDTKSSDKIVNAAGVALTVTANAGDIASSTTIQGGAGTDTLQLKADNGTATLTNVTGVETITVVDGGDAKATAGKTITLDLGSYGSALTIDGSALDGAVSTADVTTAETLTVTGGSATAALTITGGGGGDTITSGSGNDIISGGEGADSIIAGSGNDSVDGGAGADSIDAGTGNDTVLGGAGDDTISGGQGADLLTGGAGADTFKYRALNESFGTTIDTITDFVSGTDKLDIADGTGSDTIVFAGNVAGLAAAQLAITNTENSGYRLAVYDTTAQKLYVDWDQNGVINNSDLVISLSGTASLVAADVISTKGAIIGTTIADELQGTAGNDVFFSLGGNDTVLGGDGNDLLLLTNDAATVSVSNVETITGGTGADNVNVTVAGTFTINAGGGTDTLTLANGTNNVTATGVEIINGGTGNDAITLGAAVTSSAITVNGSTGNDSLTLANGTNSITVTFTNLESINGGTGDDAITLASTGQLTVNGSTGSDSLTLGDGTNTVSVANVETITGGTGNDAITLTTAGSATINGSTGSDILTLANGTNTVSVSNLETINGGTGDDAITVTVAGTFTVSGSTGNDSLTLANGANTVTVSGVETINGGTGDDAITLAAAVTASAITVNGSTGSDSLTLANGTNSITVTFSGLETITGGTGDDTITLGTAGQLTLNGSTGNDSLTLANGTNTVSVSNFETVNGGTGNDAITVTVAGTFTVDGSTGSDTLTLANGANTVSVANVETITGGTGDDAITVTTAGTFTVNGSTGSDSLTLANGANTVSISNVETITGGTGDDAITVTTAGTFTVNGSTGSDSLTLANGTNTVSVSGVETITGGTGSDSVTLGDGGNTVSISNVETITGGTGADAITVTTAGTFTVDGSTGSDSLTLANGTNTVSVSNVETITGGTGADTITVTDNAAHTITGGAGADVITGGTGADTFVFAAGANGGTPSGTVFDTIIGYQSGTDVIDFGSTSIVQYTTTSAAASGTAGVAAGTGVVTFDGADTTLAQRITAVASALGTAAAGNALVFDGGDATYIYITDGAAGAGANDVLIKLQGITYDTSHDTLTIVSGDITGLA